MPKKGLDKELFALIVQTDTENKKIITETNNCVVEIDINKIEPNRNQPRKKFDQFSLNELANSIREHGVIQPILVNNKNDYYEIVTGERRWRAARIAGISTIPTIIKDYSVLDTLEISLIENIQREDLNPIEESLIYKRFADDFGLSQDQIAKKVGKSRSVISNAIRLLNLDTRVCNFVIENKISSGHARALLAISDNNLQFELAERIIEEQLSVRDIERIVKAEIELNNIKKESKYIKSEFLIANKSIESDLNSLLGTKVKISQMRNNKGKIEIEYYSPDDLNRIIGLIKNS